MDVASKFRELERRAQALGLPVTVQRRAALKALVERRDHPTADEVYTDVVRELPGVSKATVYRALDNLVQLGLARRVHHNGTAVRFDGNVERHHHLHCVRCGTIADVDVESCDAGSSFDVPGAFDAFDVFEVSVSFHGICQPCAEHQREQESTP